MSRARTGLLLGLLAALACRRLEYRCEQDTDCAIEDRPLGTCEPNGWCSYAHDECPSGRLYGDLVGDGLARTCVPIDGDEGSSGASSGASSSSGSG
ncbi:MAG: hypothetical protein K1X88_20460 [Nannocystaceae bacterium]|nr:hypothetical protein [Nannocystaceae bacterium]